MTKQELVAAVAAKGGYTQKAANDFLSALADVAADSVSSGGEFVLPGVVKLTVKAKPARVARNPATGAGVHVAAKRVIAAKVPNDLARKVA